MRLTRLERVLWARGVSYVAGVDEVGRGPLAGPVVAAAVVLPPDVDLPGVRDSKKLSEKAREAAFGRIQAAALAYGVGIVDVARIEEINILSLGIADGNLVFDVTGRRLTAQEKRSIHLL